MSTPTFVAAVLCILAQVSSPGGAPAEKLPAPWTYQDLTDGKIPPPFTVRADHPRLLITPENKADIREKIRGAPAIWRRVIDDAEQGSGEDLVLACGAIYQLGLVEGFDYALKREAYGRKGVAELMTFEYEKHRGGGTGNWGRGMLMAPCGYDWLHELLSDDQKKDLVGRTAALRSHPEFVGGFNSPGGAGMLLGLAFYGDGVDDAAAKQIVDEYWDVWWSPTTEKSRNLAALLRYLPGGGNTEGLGYFPRNWPFFRTIAAWKTATGQDYFAHMGYFRSVPYWVTHASVPSRRSEAVYALPLAKYNADRGPAWNPRLNWLVATATGYLSEVDPRGAALARWWVDRFRGFEETGLVGGLLIGDPRVKPRSPAELDLQRTFVMRGPNQVYMRSRWDDLDATALAFANTRYLMRGASTNCFSLWKNRGALLPYRGMIARHQYWGKHGEWPLNSVIFYQDETLVRPHHVSGLEPAAEAGSLEVGTLAVASEPGRYDFVRGTCPKAYRAPKDSGIDVAVSRAERTMLYLRPIGEDKTDYVVLLDRLATGSDSLHPHVVFQSVFEPKFGVDWDGDDRGKLVHDGQWAIENAPCVTVTNDHLYDFKEDRRVQAHARAFLKVLYPQRIQTLKIGGPEHFMDGIHGRGSEDDSYYRGFRTDDRNEQVLAGGYWRFHVVPAEPATEHVILTVIEATDSNVHQPTAMELFEAEGCLAAHVGPNVVVFSNTGGILTAASAKVTGAGATRIVIADLAPGVDYTLSAGGTRIELKATEAGTSCAANVELSAGDLIRIER